MNMGHFHPQNDPKVFHPMPVAQKMTLTLSPTKEVLSASGPLSSSFPAISPAVPLFLPGLWVSHTLFALLLLPFLSISWPSSKLFLKRQQKPSLAEKKSNGTPLWAPQKGTKFKMMETKERGKVRTMAQKTNKKTN